MSVALTGLGGGGPGEDRAVASLQVEHNGQTYDWSIYIPKDLETDLGTYIESIEANIYADIDAKEAAWEALTPKTRETVDIETGETISVDISKTEIVHPDMPDYYAKRRAEYPALTEQLDALWKGGDAASEMTNKIQAIKEKYPKP
jgi:hypothetical protein